MKKHSARRAPPMTTFVWAPGMGADAEALSRLCRHFERPATLMGEAWFMSEDRRIFDELAGDLSQLDSRTLHEALGEIAGGIGAFGPIREWDGWYHYLLGRILPRAQEGVGSSLLESLITGFIALYPDGVVHPPYPRFLNDVLSTLGRCMMGGRRWDETECIASNGSFSASMFLCLKYLPASCVHDWLRSVLAIPDPNWRAQQLAWLVGSYCLLAGRISWPGDFPNGAWPSVDWEFSHCLGTQSDRSAHFLPLESREIALQLIRTHFSVEVYIAWLESIASVPSLEAELAGIPSSFEELYVTDPIA
jgi:hypothetical protein